MHRIARHVNPGSSQPHRRAIGRQLALAAELGAAQTLAEAKIAHAFFRWKSEIAAKPRPCDTIAFANPADRPLDARFAAAHGGQQGALR